MSSDSVLQTILKEAVSGKKDMELMEMRLIYFIFLWDWSLNLASHLQSRHLTT
jgi:hypothetical protein